MRGNTRLARGFIPFAAASRAAQVNDEARMTNGECSSSIVRQSSIVVRHSPSPPRLGGPTYGYTLVELVVVIMILGILAAIGAPRLLRTSDEAVDNGLRHTLEVIRGAIDLYAAGHEGSLPGADGVEQTLKDDLARHLRGTEFPTCPVGEAKNGRVRMLADETAIDAGMAATAATHSWVYCYETGRFGVNSQEESADGTAYADF
jgi:general secretion pathway protein G